MAELCLAAKQTGSHKSCIPLLKWQKNMEVCPTHLNQHIHVQCGVQLHIKPGRIVQLVVSLIQKVEVPGSVWPLTLWRLIFSLQLIKEGQLSVISESMCT